VWEHLLTGVRARTPVSARGLTTGDARALRPPGEPEVKLARSVVDDWSGPGEAGTVPLLRRPVELAAKLVEAGRCALVDAGWDGVTPLVLVHPGAGGVAKRWPVPDFARVLARLGETSPIALAIHAGPADHDAATALRDLLGAARRSAPPLVLWEPGLGTLAGALACADLYLGNDSGVSHLAAAVGTPSLVLFMPESLRWVPWSHTARPLVVSSHGGEAEAGAVLAAAARAMPRRATTRGAAGRAPCPTAAPA
jgi:ADP-heptose:LPS heptosyltransferase